MDDYLTPEMLEQSGFDQTSYDVGPQSDGTYEIPSSAQPTNTAWDAGGGTTGDYRGALDILRLGIGAVSQYKKNSQFLDYQRYEATQGGLFPQGRPNAQMVQGQASVSAFGNPMMLMLMAGFAILLLRK